MRSRCGCNLSTTSTCTNEDPLFARLRGLVRVETDSIEEQLAKLRQLPPDWQRDLIGILDLLHNQHVKQLQEKAARKQPRKKHAA
jgi:hypothetical protein